VRTTTFDWDDAHNLTAWSDTDAPRPIGQQTASGTASYDDDNRKTGETVTYPNPAGQPYSLSYSYQYSPAGKKTRLVWADGTAIDYGYSAHGELDSVTIPGEGILSVSQFKWMVPASVILPGGSVQNKAYDGLLKLEGLKVKSPGQQTLLELANRYGKSQELTSRTRADTVAGVTGTVTGSFSYDDELRLTQSSIDAGTGQDTETFTLDAVGNRTGHSRVLGEWNYDANNRLNDKGLLLDAVSYDYDEAGNLIRKTEIGQVRQYGYDIQNRLIEVKDGNGNLIARYGYDPFDRRIWKEQYRDRSGNVLAQARRSYYLYADEGLIAESRQDITLDANDSVSAGAEPAIATQYGPRPDAEFTTGVLFVKTKNSNGDDTVAYYHHDHLETPIQATDKQGNVVWSAQYNVFGRATITTPAASPDKPTISSVLRLPGQIEDEETGLHYNWHRYYEPGVGRYVTEDPIGLLGGINRYAYVGGNPVSYSDPTGKFANLAIGALSGVASGYIIAQLTGGCYGIKDALVDAALGAVGTGLSSKLEKIRELSKLRNLARERGLVPNKITPHIEDYINPKNPLERLKIKLSPSEKAPGSLSQGPRVEYRIEPGIYKNPFTGEIGRAPEFSHIPIGDPSSTGAVVGGSIGGAAGAAGDNCGCN
jgi:RHS repeat-associated protein